MEHVQTHVLEKPSLDRLDIFLFLLGLPFSPTLVLELERFGALPVFCLAHFVISISSFHYSETNFLGSYMYKNIYSERKKEFVLECISKSVDAISFIYIPLYAIQSNKMGQTGFPPFDMLV